MPGNYWVEIEQEVSIDSMIDDHYHVETNVWIRDWCGHSITLEKAYRDYYISCDDIPIVKKRQLMKAETLKEKLLIALKDFKKCEFAD
jgi:hypothetical protein